MTELDPNDFGDLPTYEKEKIFTSEVHDLIDRFSSEYNITYAQIIGSLQFIIHDLIVEGFEEGDEDDES